MRKFSIQLIGFAALAFVLTCVIFPLESFGCGTERWPVKVVQDDHAKYFFKDRDISTGELAQFVVTTIAQLSAQPWPFTWKKNKFPELWTYKLRHGQAEFVIWQINATIIEKRNEDDGDYHLVLRSGKRKMIGEIPAEECVEATPAPLKEMIRQARKDFDDYIAAGHTASNMKAKVRLTGIGFFDRVHGGVGQVKKNGIELHPIIKIEFLDL